MSIPNPNTTPAPEPDPNVFETSPKASPEPRWAHRAVADRLEETRQIMVIGFIICGAAIVALVLLFTLRQ